MGRMAGGRYGTPVLAAVAMLVGPAHASETTTYSYDALGRLKAATISGGTNAGKATAVCYDAAGNRSTYVVVLSGSATCTQASTLSQATAVPMDDATSTDVTSGVDPSDTTDVVVPSDQAADNTDSGSSSSDPAEQPSQDNVEAPAEENTSAADLAG